MTSALEAVLGRALLGDALLRTALSTLFFFSVNFSVQVVCARHFPPFNQLSPAKQLKFRSFSTSAIHSILASALCLALVVFPDTDIEADRVYGYSLRANRVFSITVGFFLYDLYNCFPPGGCIQWEFIAHHLASAVCYVFVQFPFLAYYAVRLLLYELSTPFLNLRQILLLLGHTGTPTLRFAEKSFGIVFVLVRILMGVPLSALAFRDVYLLVTEGEPHSVGIVAYFTIANLGLNGLNLHWLRLLIRTARKKRGASAGSGGGDKKQQ